MDRQTNGRDFNTSLVEVITVTICLEEWTACVIWHDPSFNDNGVKGTLINVKLSNLKLDIYNWSIIYYYYYYYNLWNAVKDISNTVSTNIHLAIISNFNPNQLNSTIMYFFVSMCHRNGPRAMIIDYWPDTFFSAQSLLGHSCIWKANNHYY